MISVIVPVYNSEKTIRSCLESILGQKTNEPFEVIVVNDASTDSSEKEILAFSKKIIYIKNPSNKGPAFSRNLGAKKAKGEIVCFIDADCVAEKNWLLEMTTPFADKKVAAVQGAYKTKQKELVARFVQEEIEQRYEKMRRAKNLDWVGSYSAAYRKDVFAQENGFDESFPMASGEDPDLSFRVAKKGHKIVFNEKAIVYHTHPNTLTKYLTTKFWRAYYRVLLYKKHPSKAVKDSYTPSILKFRLAFLVFVVATFLVILTSIFSEGLLIWVLVGELLFIFASSLPFSVKAFFRDWQVGVVSPFFLFFRDTWLLGGLFLGTVKTVVK